MKLKGYMNVIFPARFFSKKKVNQMTFSTMAFDFSNERLDKYAAFRLYTYAHLRIHRSFDVESGCKGEHMNRKISGWV